MEIIKVKGFKTGKAARDSAELQIEKVLGFGWNKQDKHFYKMKRGIF